jgi:hypothetical protein
MAFAMALIDESDNYRPYETLPLLVFDLSLVVELAAVLRRQTRVRNTGHIHENLRLKIYACLKFQS